jgi:hypothetical protein
VIYVYLLFKFRNNPVTITIDLQFTGSGKDVLQLQQNVAGIMFEDFPRFRYMNSIGHLVGDLLVFYDTWEYILHVEDYFDLILESVKSFAAT